MIAVDFGGAQRPGRNLPTGESPLPLPVRTSFCLVSYELFSSMLLVLRDWHVEVRWIIYGGKAATAGPAGGGGSAALYVSSFRRKCHLDPQRATFSRSRVRVVFTQLFSNKSQRTLLLAW